MFRLFLITVSVILWISLAIAGLRYMGRTQQYAPWPHPLKSQPLKVRAKTANITCESAAKTTSADHNFFWLDVAVNENGHWIVQPDGESLEQCLSHSPDLRLVMNFIAPPHLPLAEAVKVLKEKSNGEHVMLSSPFQKVIAVLREEMPQYLTLASTAEVAKARLFTGLFLESLATIDADVIVLPKAIPRLLDEMERRHKIVLIEQDGYFVTPQSAPKVDPTAPRE